MRTQPSITKFSEREYPDETVELFTDVLYLTHKMHEQRTYLPIKARALIAANMAIDQDEARIFVDTINHEWNLV